MEKTNKTIVCTYSPIVQSNLLDCTAPGIAELAGTEKGAFRSPLPHRGPQGATIFFGIQREIRSDPADQEQNT